MRELEPEYGGLRDKGINCGKPIQRASQSRPSFSITHRIDANPFEKIEDFSVQKLIHSLAVDPVTHRVYAPEQEEDGKPVSRMLVFGAGGTTARETLMRGARIWRG